MSLSAGIARFQPAEAASFLSEATFLQPAFLFAYQRRR